MSDNARSHVANLILGRLGELANGQDQIRSEIAALRRAFKDLSADVDQLDRGHRPFGDGTRLHRGRQRG
jgi:hypothetical protein